MPVRARGEGRHVASRWVRRAVVAFLFAPVAPASGGDGPAVDYNRDVRPVLSRNCFACHGRDPDHREKGLRLDVRDDALRDRDGVTAVVPGSPDESELIAKVVEEDESLRMPPRKAGPRLKPAEVEVLKRWVAQGAPYAEHWAFVRPARRPLPTVKDPGWVRNGVDAWVLARLEKEGLRPSPEADRFALLRRVSLDLRGLPPTPDEVDRFAADESPVAYERAVDRLLADPAYGERMARVWLDLARYADSAGYGSDPLRTIWRYRDWVIDAFNRNLPYDRFTVEQVAGDLLPGATRDQKLATAFHRNTMTNTEGGTDDEEFRVAAVKDRVDTTAQVWMGLTLGCAKCHSHKYDPFTHEDYYKFFALFNQTADADRPDEAPVIPSPTAEDERRDRAIGAKIDGLKAVLTRSTPELEADQKGWEAERSVAVAWAPVGSFKAPSVVLGTPPLGRWPVGLTFRVDAGGVRVTNDPRARLLEGLPTDVLAALEVDPQTRSTGQNDRLAAAFRSVAPRLKPVREEIAALEKSRPKPPTVPVMVELPVDKQRKTHVLLKGNFLTPGPAVSAGLPGALHPLPAGAKSDRLGLASWLVDGANPLTARVAVNREWAQLFGTGLVETEEDFGSQGDPPSHPELLDWMAEEYVRLGWDTKALLRLLVTSAAYRQSSHARPDLAKVDPRNRLIARGPRFRLEAEIVRDQALALGGLLDRKVGGPSVFPPQPPGLWQAAFNGQRTWATSPGGDKHRRGLYTFWRRTIPYPSMATFDAPSRELCSVKRTRTNTPLQAFVTLNDPVYVEAAQALARRVVAEGGSSPEGRARYALKLALARPPADAQVEQVMALYRTERDHYAKDAVAAEALATQPIGPLPQGADAAEYAAWTTVANVLLNLDAVLTKG